MSRKNNYRKLLQSNKKERYKMYKSGKYWVYATITAYGSILGLSSAETVQAVSPEAGKELDPGDILANKDSTQIPAAPQSDEVEDSSVTEESFATEESMVTEESSSTEPSSSAESYFEDVVPEGSKVTVDDSTNELNIELDSMLNPSKTLIEKATQYSEENNLVTNFSQRVLDVIKDRVNVAIDLDAGRVDFENELNNPTDQPSPTSVDVALPDQIANLASYKAEAQSNNTYAAVSDWAGLKSVYADNKITFIEFTSDFSAPENVDVRDLGWRATDLIIDGGGHTINMGRATFSVGTNATVRGSIFTMNNVNLIHWAIGGISGDTGDNRIAADAVIDSQVAPGGYGYWNFNINDVQLEGRDGPGGPADFQPQRLLCAEDSQVTLSGTIKAAAKLELMHIGQVDIVNGSHVELNRTAGTTGFSMFYFMNVRPNQPSDTGYAHTFTAGDGVTIIGNELEGFNGNTYPMVYFGFDEIKVGDNVDWHQDGFQMLIDTNRYLGENPTGRSVTFGQNLNMTATRTVGYNSLWADWNSTITFNAGTKLNLEQWNPASVVYITSGSNVKFISPESLHISRNTLSGAPNNGNLFSGAGTFEMNNSQISTWQGDNSATNPGGSRNAKFANLSVVNSSARVTDTAGNTTASDIIDRNTRELSTNALNPGTVKLNYVDQYGQKIKSVDYPLSSTDNYIGQFIQLKTKDFAETHMPENYMWAIGDQVPTSAVDDKQSGGDLTSTEDDGDRYGQANIGIVPMEGTEYEYNIYVYGKPNAEIKYEYEDVNTGQLVKSMYVNSEQEKAGTNLDPANFGNKIDWTSDYYTKTNVPQGYHYATGDELDGKTQPVETVVGTDAKVVKMYLVADKQTVNVTFEKSDGLDLVDQTKKISIDGFSGQEIQLKDLLKGKVTEKGYHISGDDKFTFDNTDNKGSATDKEVQELTVTLEPDYQLVGIISNNSPMSDPATGKDYPQLPTTVTEGEYSHAGVSNGEITLGKTDADLARNGYIYKVKGPDGKIYETLADALAANNKHDTTSNGTNQSDSDPQSFEVIYETDPVSESQSTSTSASISLSTSTSLSDSSSFSTSTSLSDSSSLSTSSSTSGSLSDSSSLSLSTSDSLSLSDSTSLSASYSESLSISASDSVSLSGSYSESLSVSLSDSSSDSISHSESLSISVSDSKSLSDSNSLSESISLSDSISKSNSGSQDGSTSLSESISLSDSISLSTSISLSDSTSLSDSNSDSSSISESISLSDSLSDSNSDSSSLSDSISLSDSLSDSISLSESISLSDSIS
ncbi:pectate lyase-like adhesive domain-containing protein, partial [Enterococcus sp. LJL98]